MLRRGPGLDLGQAVVDQPGAGFAQLEIREDDHAEDAVRCRAADRDRHHHPAELDPGPPRLGDIAAVDDRPCPLDHAFEQPDPARPHRRQDQVVEIAAGRVVLERSADRGPGQPTAEPPVDRALVEKQERQDVARHHDRIDRGLGRHRRPRPARAPELEAIRERRATEQSLEIGPGRLLGCQHDRTSLLAPALPRNEDGSCPHGGKPRPGTKENPPAPADRRILSSRRIVRRYMLSAWPDTARAASLTASFRVGWAWQVRPISSDDAPYSMASAHSAIIVPASGPMICTPRTWSVLASAMNFTKPSVSPFALARPLAVNGNLPTLYSVPAALTSSSVLPTDATSGQV